MKDQRPSGDGWAFMSVHPFDRLAEDGWTVTDVSTPRKRPGQRGQVRVAVLTDGHGRVFSFDVDERNRMSGHATFLAGKGDAPLFAVSPCGVALLAGSDPAADHLVLAALTDVHTLETLRQ